MWNMIHYYDIEYRTSYSLFVLTREDFPGKGEG